MTKWKKREKKAFQKFIYIWISWSVYPILFRVQVFTATQNSCCDTCLRRRAKLFRSQSLSISISIAVVCQTLWQKLLAQDAWMYRMKMNMELYNTKCKQMEGYLVITCYWKIFFYAFHQISTPKNFLSHEHIFSFVSI